MQTEVFLYRFHTGITNIDETITSQRNQTYGKRIKQNEKKMRRKTTFNIEILIRYKQ